MAETALTQAQPKVRSSISLIGGSICIVIALLLIIMGLDAANEISTFVLTSQRAGVTIKAPDLVLPTNIALFVLAALTAVLGVVQIVTGSKRVSFFVGLSAIALVFGFLIWATHGKSLNLTGMLVSSVIRATPIAFAALAGIYSERSGVVNIGIEGMMLMGAFTSVVVASVTKNLFLGVLAGILAGLLMGALHAVLSIKYMVNQIISGTVLIILGLGITTYLTRLLLDVYPEQLNTPPSAIPSLQVFGLWRIPVIGPIVFNQSSLIYLLWVMLIFTQILYFKTRWGLRVRSVGEHPKAADTLGINVFRTRYISVLISGAIGGLAGTYISLGVAGQFTEGISAGKGFLGLAAMIFGNWMPGGAYLGAIIFGFFDSWQEKLSILQIGIPVELLAMAPYIATMIVLSGFIGRSRMPAADGTPYKKE
jgi:general nucleoside transport system permease protein